ncbi:hypothetical protein [Nodosilinea nodulosa]|nr:hypothetical protein [Nodosilinea nodulosa]
MVQLQNVWRSGNMARSQYLDNTLFFSPQSRRYNAKKPKPRRI